SDSPLRGKLERVKRLEHQGASVHLASIDVGDEGALTSFLDEFHAEGWPTIRGVVHCAGVFDAGAADPDSFCRTARGKALGAYHLHRALPELETLVLFSSISSVVPQPNVQYAAANAVLDSLASARQAAGLPTISLSWGAWAQSGMAVDGAVARYLQVMRTQGVSDLPAELASSLLAWTAQSGDAHLLLADIDWAIAGERLVRGIHQGFFGDLV